MHSTSLLIMDMLLMNTIQILSLLSMTVAAVLLSYAAMITTKIIVLSVNGSRVHQRKYNYPLMRHASYRTHPDYV